MNSDIIDIDHVIVSVRDSAEAGDVFSRMGFTVTPRSLLPGLSNRLICFPGEDNGACNFVELMSLENPEKAPPQMPEVLKDPDRPVSLVVATRKAEETRNRLHETGLDISPVMDLSRKWELPSGEVIVPAFSVVTPSIGQAPLYWILCQHKTPQHYSRREFVQHDNGAEMLTSVIAVARDPLGAAEHFEKYWGASMSGAEPVVVRRGAVELHIHSPEGFQKEYSETSLRRSDDHIVGFSVRTKKLDTLHGRLEDAGFAPRKIGSRIEVHHTRACGCLVVFDAAHD